MSELQTNEPPATPSIDRHKGKRGSMPTTCREWQDAVDAAHAALMLDSARQYGLVTRRTRRQREPLRTAPQARQVQGRGAVG